MLKSSEQHQVVVPAMGLLSPFRHPAGDGRQLGDPVTGFVAVDHVHGHKNDRGVTCLKADRVG